MRTVRIGCVLGMLLLLTNHGVCAQSIAMEELKYDTKIFGIAHENNNVYVTLESLTDKKGRTVAVVHTISESNNKGERLWVRQLFLFTARWDRAAIPAMKRPWVVMLKSLQTAAEQENRGESPDRRIRIIEDVPGLMDAFEYQIPQEELRKVFALAMTINNDLGAALRKPENRVLARGDYVPQYQRRNPAK